MIGRFSIGSRYVGAGRSVLRPPFEGSATLPGAAGLSANGSRTLSASFTLAGAAGLSVSEGFISKLGSATLPGVATLVATGSAKLQASATLAGAAGLSASGKRQVQGAVEFEGVAGLDVDGRVTRPGSITFAGEAEITADGVRTADGAATFSASAGLTAAGARTATASATLPGVATMTANGTFPAFSARVRIPVFEKLKGIVVPEKIRTIVYPGDDQEIQVEQFVKQPSEVVDYELDMRDWFKRIRSDGIDSITTVVSPTGDPSDIEVGPGALPDSELIGSPAHQARIWLGGGRDGVTYQVTATVTTTEGRVEEVDFLVIVENE